MSEIVGLLINEETALLRRLAAVRAALKAYQPEVIQARHAKTKIHFIGGISAQIVNVAKDAMVATGRRMNSTELFAIACQRGVQIRGERPAAAVSAILSQSAMFDNKRDARGEGYGLLEWTVISPPQGEAPASLGGASLP
jgi:hypothetical protein